MMNSTRPEFDLMPERMAMIRLAPHVLADLLQLPAGSYIDAVETRAQEPGVLHLRLRGAGYEVRRGDLIPRAPDAKVRTMSDGENRWPVVTWDLPQAEAVRSEATVAPTVSALAPTHRCTRCHAEMNHTGEFFEILDGRCTGACADGRCKVEPLPQAEPAVAKKPDASLAPRSFRAPEPGTPWWETAIACGAWTDRGDGDLGYVHFGSVAALGVYASKIAKQARSATPAAASLHAGLPVVHVHGCSLPKTDCIVAGNSSLDTKDMDGADKSVALNRVVWLLAEALGRVPEGAGVVSLEISEVTRAACAVIQQHVAPPRSGIENSVELAPVLGQVRFGDMGEPWDTRYPLGMLAEDVRRELAAFTALQGTAR